MIAIPRLHLISNRDLCGLDRFPDVARQSALGGAGAIHIREPGLDPDEISALAERTLHAVRETGVRVLVNRSIDIAVSTGADGVHLAETQIDEIQSARRMLPEGALIGASVHSREFALAASGAGADYLIAGHVFETGSKPGSPGRGLAFIRETTTAVPVPVIAIGGITPQNARAVIHAGAHGIAVLSAILAAADPAAVAREFARTILDPGGGMQ